MAIIADSVRHRRFLPARVVWWHAGLTRPARFAASPSTHNKPISQLLQLRLFSVIKAFGPTETYYHIRDSSLTTTLPCSAGFITTHGLSSPTRPRKAAAFCDEIRLDISLIDSERRPVYLSPVL
jgi:hypothetical protein